MKRTSVFLVMVVLASVIVGCAPIDSLQPLYTKEGNVFEGTLLGEWQLKAPETDEDKNSRWVFENRGTNIFTVFA